jgi:hypothetical protein
MTLAYPTLTFRFIRGRDEWKPVQTQRAAMLAIFESSVAGEVVVWDMIADMEHELRELRKELMLAREAKINSNSPLVP